MMTDDALQAESATGTRPGPTLRDEAETLQEAIRQSISTSPGAFLKTIDDVDEMSIEYWEKDISSFTWAVIQKGGDVVGIAVARPNREIDGQGKPGEVRFIESVWITPELRGHQLGERLVRFLFEMECRKDQNIRQFLLWVFDENRRAIRLYQRMGFEDTGISQQVNRIGRTELKFKYQYNTVKQATAAAVNDAARREDLRRFGVRYRILGEDVA
jgi:ribosomal protein S18 acetylase RimI-like enzyme